MKYWLAGPQLPYALAHASSVQYEDSLLVIGGYKGIGNPSRDILSLNANSPMKWKMRREKLGTGLYRHGSVLVSSDKLKCF